MIWYGDSKKKRGMGQHRRRVAAVRLESVEIQTVRGSY